METTHQDEDIMQAEIECKDLDFFLEATPINEEIYRRLLTISRHDDSNIPFVEVFRWAYYFLYRITVDDHPETMLDTDYYDEMADWDESTSNYYIHLVYVVMRTLLELQPELSKKQDRSLEQLAIMTYEYGAYWVTFEKIVSDHRSKKESYGIDFYYLDFDVKLPEDITTADWYELTHGYDEDYIEKFVQMGATQAEQAQILSAIYARYKTFAHQQYNHSANDPLHKFFESQVDLIKLRFQKKKAAVSTTPSDADPVEVEALKEKISELENELEKQNTDKQGNTMKGKCLVVELLLKKINVTTANTDLSKIARLAAYLTGTTEKHSYKIMQPGIELGDYHADEIKRINKIMQELNIDISL